MTRAVNPVPQGGFMLIEALIAILIFSVGIASLIGLQSMAARYSTDAKFRSTAGYLASQCLAQIWVADRAAMDKACVDSDPLAELPSGKRTVAFGAGSSAESGYLVTVTIEWTLPGDGSTHKHVAVANIHDRCDVAGCPG